MIEGWFKNGNLNEYDYDALIHWKSLLSNKFVDTDCYNTMELVIICFRKGN